MRCHAWVGGCRGEVAATVHEGKDGMSGRGLEHSIRMRANIMGNFVEASGSFQGVLLNSWTWGVILISFWEAWRRQSSPGQ